MKTTEQKTGFEFQEKGHKYFLDGKAMTGVTTILGVIAKPALIGWASKMATEFIAQAIKDGKEITPEVLELAKNAHRAKKEEAGGLGTDVHKECELLITSSLEGNKGVFTDDLKHENPQVQHFIDWAIQNKVKFIATEEKVFSRDLFVAGTIDFICEIDGNVWLGDIKTASGIYPEFFFQTAGYQKLNEDMVENEDGGFPVNIKGHVITCLTKTGEFIEKRSISNKENLEAFLAALTLYRVTQKLNGTII